MCPVVWTGKGVGGREPPWKVFFREIKIGEKIKPRCRSLRSKVFKIDTPQEVHVANPDARFRQERAIPILTSEETKHWYELCIFDVRRVSCFPIVLRHDVFFLKAFSKRNIHKVNSQL